MKSESILSHSVRDTVDTGIKIGRRLTKGSIICLFGDLGSGKTTFVKGVAQGMNIDPDEVHSPTFTLMNAYSAAAGKPPLMFHFDLYRVSGLRDVFALDYEEYLYGGGVAVVEWAEKLGPLMPRDYLSVELKHKSDNERIIKIREKGGCKFAI